MHYKGFDANIELRSPVDGRTKIKCQLGGVRGNEVIKLRMIENGEPKNEEVIVDFSNIRRAKLILTDKLINASQNNQI